MDINTFTIVSLTGFAGLAGLARVLYGRFRKSGANEIEPFLRYAVRGVKYYFGRYVRRQLAAELTLRQYARLHLQTTAREMLVPATYPKQLEVDRMFVPLLLRGGGQDRIEYDQILTRHSDRLLILGEPGSGKSSLMKRVFRDACRRAATSARQAQLPILLELRTLRRQQATIDREGLFKALTASVEDSAVYGAQRATDLLRHGPGLLVLLDGLDEVPSNSIDDTIDAIIDLSTELKKTAPRSTLVVTSRTQHFLSLQRRDLQEAFRILTIQAFSLGDVYKFLTSWPFEADRRANVVRIFSRIRQLTSLTEMCTNPLALAMFVVRDEQTGGSEQPETRSRFYQAYIEELVVKRRSRRDELSTGRLRLQKARQQLLGEVCFGHLTSPTEAPNSIPEHRFAEAIEHLRYGGGDIAAALSELATDTGLFMPERHGETLRFLHLTLCEFFAALELVERGESAWDELLKLLRQDDPGGTAPDRGFSWEGRLSEVISFACGLAPRSLQQRILGDLADSSDHKLLLRAAVEGQSYDEPEVRTAILNECEEIAGSAPSEWGVDWFAKLRLLIIVLRDAETGIRPEIGPCGAELPSGTALLTELMALHDAEMQLLPTLARMDADSAIGLAEGSANPEARDAIAAAADDFAVLQGILARIEAGVEAWRLALVMRAHVNRNVATLLRAMVDDREPAQDRNWHRWTACWITGQCR